MSNVLTQTIVYVILLFAGYGFKKAGIFKVEDTDFLKKVILYLTMPAMAVNGLKDLELQPSFLWCFLVGFGTSTILMLVGMAVTRRKSPEERVMYLFNFNTYNIGNFAIPFLTGLISTEGFAALCLFDIGVAIYLYGIDYSLAEAVKGGKGSFSLKFLLKKIFTSPITDMYLLMILLAALHLRLPDPILKLASVMGNANAFLAMLSIGILFELNLEKKNIRDMVKFFVLRYGTILLIMAGVILLIPFSQDIRQAICVLLMAPVASIAPLLTMNAGGDGAKAAQINSVSILIGIAGMMVVYALV
ncbi:MAG TPA: AEC family transporter [Candidatus Blautia stercorigallinarum]|uniref:AEC family transporter n=1 Tax=Candidatus Blautia stercorigallinarum TaxID=2838501 RepID=A0A9D1PDS5_9FIRM|nr:AEC family transporter [Candidatus Blautia stercorigallinarum]